MARKKLYRTEEEIKERNRKKSRKSYWKNKQITDIDKILREWSYRSQDGKPNFSMRSLDILESVLIDFNWSRNERLTLIKQIGESKMNSAKLTNENKMIIEPIPYQQKSEPKSFSDRVKALKVLWDSDPKKYSSTPLGVYNTNMSPKEYFTYVRRQSDIDALEEFKLSDQNHLISNSPNNRKESKTGDLFVIRMRYSYTMIAGVSDSNFFPLSLIDNSDDVGEKIKHLILKDRGNLTSVLKRYDEEVLNVNQWQKVFEGIESNPFNEFKLKNDRFKKILKRSKSILSKHVKPIERINTKYSLKTMLGADVWDEWYNFDQSLNIRITYETLGVHTNEMQAYNNTETNWIEYNFLTSAITLSSYYDSDSIDKSQLINIHNSCIDEDVFTGKKDHFLSKVKHKKQEGFESWFPIDYSALETLSWDDFINQLSRSKQTADKKKKKAWSDLFSKKDKKDKFITYDIVNENISLIKSISNLPKSEEFESELESFISVDKSRNITNIKDLSLKNHYNVGIITRASKELSKKIYKSRDDNSRRVKVAEKLLDTMVKAIKDGELKVFINDTDLSNTTMTRYNYFYKKVIKKTEVVLDALANNGKLPFDSDYWWSELRQGLAENHIFANRDGILLVWDQKDYGMFVKHEINFSHKTGLSECHMNPKLQETTDNIFLGLPLDNELNGKKPIKNLQRYISEFEVNMDEWLKNNEDRENRTYTTRMLNEVINDIWLKIGNN